MRSKIRWFTYSAIHTTYRILLRSSSLREPRDPLSKVVFKLFLKKFLDKWIQKVLFKKRSFLKNYYYPLKLKVSFYKTFTHSGKDRNNFSKKIIQTNKFTKGRIINRPNFKWPYFLMILPQVHLRKPCYDFYFL